VLVGVVVVVGGVLSGCGEAGPGPRAQPTTQPSAQPTTQRTTHPAPAPTVPLPRPVSHPALYARAVRLLEAVAASDVAESESFHGGPAESLGGRWRGLAVVVGVVPASRAGAEPVRPRVLSWPVVSLRPGLEAFVGGGDSAALLPFEQVVRAGGAPQRVAEPDDAQTEGVVVLGDGRVLTLPSSSGTTGSGGWAIVTTGSG
jgi:hypothetical protein